MTYAWDDNHNKISETITGTMSNYGFSIPTNGYDGEHNLVVYAPGGEYVEGWGLEGDEEPVSPPVKEPKSDDPWWKEVDFEEACQYWRRSSSPVVLPYGSGTNTPSNLATDAQILDCIKNYPASGGYNPICYNCYHWVWEATKACGLSCSNFD